MKKLAFKTISLVVLCLFCTCCINDLSAQLITWTALGDKKSWSDADNWTPRKVPTATNHVVIGNGTVVLDVYSATIQSMVMNNKSHLLIPGGHTLVVKQSTGIGVRFEGNSVLENRGTFRVEETGNYGISNFSTIYNYGEIGFYDTGSWNWYNSGELINAKGASIGFYGAGGSNVFTNLESEITNQGLLYFAAKENGAGIRMDGGSLENTRDGEIIMDTDANYNFFLNVNTQVINDGNIQLHSNVTTGRASLDVSGAYFRNGKYGTVQIQEFLDNGLRIRDGGGFENSGDILINGNNQTYGIRMRKGSDFINKKSGVIQISDVEQGLKQEYSYPNPSRFYNGGVFECVNTNRAIYVNGEMTNQTSGEMYLSRNNKGIEVRNVGEFTNSGGIITFTNTSDWDIKNYGLFLNNRCSEMIHSGRIISNDDFGNFGFMSIPTDGNAHSGVSPIENYGVIFDPFDRGNFLQTGVVIPTVDNYSGAGLYTDVLDVSYWNDSEVEPDWYSDVNLTIVAGTYRKSNNTFQANSNGNGATALYAKFYDEDFPSCYKVYRIPFDSPVSTSFTDKKPAAAFRGEATTKPFKEVQLKVYPNPSTGLVQITLPTMSEANSSLQMINAQGQLILDRSFGTTNASQVIFDLNDHPVGVYFVRLVENGVIHAQEKVILLR